MPYIPININREDLSIMGVTFPDIQTLENTADALGSNMFEGFEPTQKGVEIIRDYCLGILSFEQLIVAAMERAYEE